MALASIRAAGRSNRKKRRQVWPLRVAVQIACLATLPLLTELPPITAAIVTAVLLVGTAIFGRWFCGWVCPWGTMLDGLRWAFEKTVLRWFPRLDFIVPPRAHRILLKVKYVVLAGIIPMVFLADSGTYEDSRSSGSGPASVVIIVALVLLLGLIPRAFCLYLCPIGATLAIASLPRQLRITKPRTDCGKKCLICTVNCPMRIDLANTDAVKSEECIQCLRCVDVCPRGTAQPRLTTGSAPANRTPTSPQKQHRPHKLTLTGAVLELPTSGGA